jgi:hypothetical protein
MPALYRFQTHLIEILHGLLCNIISQIYQIIKFNIVPLAPLGKIQDVQQTKSNHLIPRNASAEEDPFDPSTRLKKVEANEEAASSGQRTHLRLASVRSKTPHLPYFLANFHI